MEEPMGNKTWKYIAIGMIVVIALLIIGGGVLVLKHHHTNKPATTSSGQFTKLDIALKNGHLVAPAATYVVKPGIGLEFSISSNVFGKVSVPTSPPQTITFTQSPLVFHFYAPTKAGSYPLDYQANNNSDVIPIGSIVVN